jgi:hypothetical protein
LQVSKPALAASRKSVDLPPMEPTPAGETLHTLSPSTPLPQAMARLLHMGVAALPVVDNNGMLLDQYARADVVRLDIAPPCPSQRSPRPVGLEASATVAASPGFNHEPRKKKSPNEPHASPQTAFFISIQ